MGNPKKRTEREKRVNWPPNFFEETFGCLAEYPLERPPQGEYETRNALR